MRAVRLPTGLLLGALLTALGLAHATAQDPGDDILHNGGFEAGTEGWVAEPGTLFAVDSDGPVAEGAVAARLRGEHGGVNVSVTSTAAGGVTPSATYRASVLVHLQGDIPNVSVEFRFRDARFALLALEEVPHVGEDGAFRLYQMNVKAPPNALYASVRVIGWAVESDAVLSIDDASIVLVEGPPPPPPPDPVGSPPPTSTATPTPTSTPTATATATPTLTPSPTPDITSTLRNAGFEDGVEGWEVTRGTVTVEPALPGLGQSLVMRAGGSTTMWVQQAVTVVPGAWYSAGAALAPGAGTEAGWVRIAWYASPDASGAQMSTADSPVVASAGAAASTQAFEVVSTGPVQTPPGARSARVRILLRPAVPGATMAVGEVTFHPTAPPPPPTSMPTPTATPAPVAPAAAPAPAATPAPGAEPAPEPVAAAAPSPPARSPARTASIPAGGLPAARAAALAPAQRWVRITELLPNAVQAGIDADYEWVELTNIGASSVSLEGMRLEDNRAALEVEAVMLAPGASLVIAAPLAEVGNAAVVQRVPVIGNGLSNSGDRLALYAADGTLVDALSYGSDETYVSGERISAPRPGHSIARRFASDGTLVEVLHSAAPSPGTAEVLEPGALTPLDESEARPPQPAAATGDTAPPRPPPSVSPEPRPVESSLWIALLLVAGGLLASLATHRTLTIVRDHRAAAAPAREDGAERE